MIDAEWESYADVPGAWEQYDGGACFVRVCELCGRWVKADSYVLINEDTGLSKEPNATCRKCGRTHMLFYGFI